MNTLVAIDPGYATDGGTGIALFVDRVLSGADILRPTRGTVIERCRNLGLAAVSWVQMRCGWADLVVEWPQVYQAPKSKGDPNDLLGLAGVCAAIASAGPWTNVVAVLPRQWKGTVGKEAMNRRVLKRISDVERSRIRDVGALQHNVTDAIGIGLFHLGRLERVRTIPR